MATYKEEFIQIGEILCTLSGRYISGRGFLVANEGSDGWFLAPYTEVCYADGEKVYPLSQLLPQGVEASIWTPWREIKPQLLAVRWGENGPEPCEVRFNTLGVLEDFIIQEGDFFKALEKYQEYLHQQDQKRLQKASRQLLQFLQQHKMYMAWQETECNKYLYMYQELQKQGYFVSGGYKLIVLQEYHTTRGNTSFILSIVPANAKEATISVPRRYVALVVGRGGENIRSIQERLNMRIRIREVQE